MSSETLFSGSMRKPFRSAFCGVVVMAFALLAVGSAFAATITSAGTMGGTRSGSGTTARNVATAQDDPYCSGTYFSITGTGFVADGGVRGVEIGNVPAAWFKVGSDKTLYAQVGKGATTGPIIITTAKGTVSSDSLPGGRVNLSDTSEQGLMPGIQIVPCVSKPTITKAAVTGIKPNPAKGGKNVQVNGSGFSGVTKVTVGGMAAIFAIVQDQNMIVNVPKSAPSGKLALVITNAAGSVKSTVNLVKKG